MDDITKSPTFASVLRRANVAKPLRVSALAGTRMLRSQQGANPKGLSDVGTSEN